MVIRCVRVADSWYDGATGRSVAVQGFSEDAGMLVMLAVYAIAIAEDLPLRVLILSFGVLVAAGMPLVYALHSLMPVARQNV